MHDPVVRAGTVVDGTGAPGRTADVAVNDGYVTEVGRPVSFARNQDNTDPDQWRKLLDLAADAVAAGAPVRPQVPGPC